VEKRVRKFVSVKMAVLSMNVSAVLVDVEATFVMFVT